MILKYIGANCYNLELGKLYHGIEMEVSNEMGYRLLADKGNWKTPEMVEREKGSNAKNISIENQNKKIKEDWKRNNPGLAQKEFIEKIVNKKEGN